MEVRPSPNTSRRGSSVEPAELAAFGRVSASAWLLGAVAVVVLVLVDPGAVQARPVAAGAAAVAAMAAAASLWAPWGQLGRPWMVGSILAGLAGVAGLVAITGGAGSSFNLFFPFVVALAAYLCTPRELLLIAPAAMLASAAPIAYGGAGSLASRGFAWLLLVVTSAGLAAVVQRQRSAARRLAAEHEELAYIDPVTGISNRRGFERRAGAELARARRTGRSLTLVYLDLDNFKAVNDTRGHAAGDAVLRSVALAMAATVRGEDLVARHGGDEFAVLLPEASAEEARRAQARLLAAIERAAAAATDGAPRAVGASAGLATYPHDGDTVDSLLAAADLGLRHAKAARGASRAAAAVAEIVSAPAARATRGPGAAGHGRAERRAEGWDLRGAAERGAAAVALVLAGWFVLPMVAPPVLARSAVIAGVTLALALLALRAAAASEGRERLGWQLVGIGAVAGFIPYVGALLAFVIGIGLLLITDGPGARSRHALVDALSVFVPVATAALVYLVPEVLERAPAGVDRVAALGAVALLTLAVTCALVVPLRVGPRHRPDAWLAAAGFGVGMLASTPLIMSRHAGVSPEPDTIWLAGLPLCTVLCAVGAWLRAARRTPPVPIDADAGRRVAASTYVINGALLLLLASLLLTEGAIPGFVVAMLLGLSIPLQLARFRLTERSHERLLGDVRRSEHLMLEQYRASLVALAAALEARDGYTGRHGEETVVLAGMVARRLGLDDHEVGEVESAALLHDLGKLGIKDSVLRKPGPLDDHEWDEMRRHPVIGERILRTVPGLERVAEAVRHEHERWDGRGYPDGLAGEDVPLASRIVLACDAWHAMTSTRPYRESIGQDAAARELRDGAGSQFDPAVVTALSDVLGLNGGGAPRRSATVQAA